MKDEFGFGIIPQEEILLINGGAVVTSVYGTLKREINTFINSSDPKGSVKHFDVQNLSYYQQVKLTVKVARTVHKASMNFNTGILQVTLV